MGVFCDVQKVLSVLNSTHLKLSWSTWVKTVRSMKTFYSTTCMIVESHNHSCHQRKGDFGEYVIYSSSSMFVCVCFHSTQLFPFPNKTPSYVSSPRRFALRVYQIPTCIHDESSLSLRKHSQIMQSVMRSPYFMHTHTHTLQSIWPSQVVMVKKKKKKKNVQTVISEGWTHTGNIKLFVVHRHVKHFTSASSQFVFTIC